MSYLLYRNGRISQRKSLTVIFFLYNKTNQIHQFPKFTPA